MKPAPQLMNSKLSPRASILIALIILVPLLAGIAWLSFRPQPVMVTGHRLEFVMMGKSDKALVKAIAKRCAGVYGLPYQIAETSVPLPGSAFDPKRNQYDAEQILKLMKKNRPIPKNTRRLLITDADLWVDETGFVFGLADVSGRTAVMSLDHLKTRRMPRKSLLEDRGVNVAVHELGHTFTFEHCKDPACVMWFCETVMGLDESRETFCRGCGSRIR